MNEIHYILAICAGLLFMAWCVVRGKGGSYTIVADKPKEKRVFDYENPSRGNKR